MTETTRNEKPAAPLWGKPLNVINIGLELFGSTLEEQRVPVAYVDWVPPAAGRRDILGLLDDLVG